MNCTIQGCPGHYEAREVVHTATRNGEVVIIEGVPAEVCSICGDVLFAPETVRHIERLLAARGKPERTAPVYEYA
jgi:YgiT-type zinc finger domain-containing protein